MPYDPQTGDWYDDETSYVDWLYPGSTNQFLGGDGLLTFPGDYNKYGEMEPYEQADVNQQLTGLKSLLNVYANPMYNYLTSVATGADTFDYGQLAGGAGGVGGMAGGVGGGGGGGAVWTTPNLNYYLNPNLDTANVENELLGNYAQRIAGGESPYALQAELLRSGVVDQNKLDVYTNAINTMAQEFQGAQRAALAPPQQTAMQQWLAKTGLPNPLEGYTAETLPPELMPDTSATLRGIGQRASDWERRAREAQRTALAGAPRTGLRAPTVGATTAIQRASRPAPGTPIDPFTGRSIYEWADQGRQRQQQQQQEPSRRGGMVGTMLRPALQAVGRVRQASGTLAGKQAGYRQRRANEERAAAATHNQEVAAIAAADAARRGRTPARDRLNAQMQFLRSMGVGV